MNQLKAHFVAAISGTVISQLLAGIAQVIIVRALGVTQYGTYTLVYAWLAIVSAVMGAGLDVWLLDHGSRHPIQIRATLHRVVSLKLVVIAVCGLFFVSGVIPLHIEKTLLLYGLIAIAADSISASVWQSLRANNHHRTVAVIQTVNMLCVLLVVIAGAAQVVTTLIGAQAVVALSMCGVSWFISRRSTAGVHHAPPARLRAGIPFVISDVCAQLYTYSGTLLLAQVTSVHDVGVFRGAWSLIGYSFVIPAMIFTTTLPQLNAAPDPRHYRRVLKSAAGLLALYATGMWLVAAYIAPALLPWLYGVSYTESARMAPQLALVPIAKALSFAGVLLLIQQHHLRTRIAVQIGVVSGLWLIAPVLIARTGIAGAITVQVWCEWMLALGYIITGVIRMRMVAVPAQPPQHIYISNMHGVANVGDVAIHVAQLAMLTQRFPQAQITLAYADQVGAQRFFPMHTVVNGLSHWVYTADGHIAPLATRLRRMLALALAIPVLRWGGHARLWLTPTEQASLHAIARADLVCASGGGYLYDTPVRATWWRWLSWDWYLLADMLVAVWLGRPLVLLPQSFGPMHSRWLRWGLAYVARHAQHIYARESQSSAWLTQHGIAHTQASDMAWRLAKPSVAIPNTPPILGITAIDWGAQYAGFSRQAAYEQLLCDIMQHYVERGWQIQLFVQCHDTNPAWDDAQVAHRLAARIAHPAVHVMPFIADPHELQNAYVRLDRLLSTRLHAAILRMACGQPCVVIGYLPKAAGIMHDIGLAAWCLDITHLDAQRVMTALDSSHEQYAILARRQIIPTVFESAPSEYLSAGQP